jgi:fibronectin type 3 domain-containing protein
MTLASIAEKSATKNRFPSAGINAVRISWESVSGAKGYRILRKIPGEAEFTVIKEWTENYFRDSTAELFAEYTYVVQTIGSKPEYDSIYTQEMTILSSMGKPSTTCLSKNNGASLDWNAVEGAVSYDVFVSTVSEKEGFTLLLNTTSTYYLHTEVQPNKIYYYKVVAIGQGGLRVEGSVHKLHIRCATPRVTLELDAVSGKPVLTWEAVEGATKGYEIYRATYGGKLKKLKTVKTLRFVDTSATAGGDYRYEVRALGSGKDYNSKWEETGYIVAKCAQPKATVKLNKSGDPVVSWKKVSGAKQYIVMYVDVTDFIDSETGPSDFYLEQNMQYTTTTKTSVTLKTPGDRMYLITMIAVPKYADAHSTPSDPVIVITK